MSQSFCRENLYRSDAVVSLLVAVFFSLNHVLNYRERITVGIFFLVLGATEEVSGKASLWETKWCNWKLSHRQGSPPPKELYWFLRNPPAVNCQAKLRTAGRKPFHHSWKRQPAGCSRAPWGLDQTCSCPGASTSLLGQEASFRT